MAENNNSSKNLSNVAVLRFSAIGDVAMSIPVVYSVAKANPECRFIFVTRKGFDRLFVNAPDNVEVRAFDLEGYKGPLGIARMFREIKSEFGKISKIVDLHDVIRSRIFSFAGLLHGGAGTVRIDKGRAQKRALVRRDNKEFVQLPLTVDRYSDTFRRAGFSFDVDFKSLYGSGKSDAGLFSSVTGPRGENETWVGVAPFAKHPGKIYPPEKMAEVVEALASRSGMKVFLFGGGKSEENILSEWVNKYSRNGNVVSLAGRRLGFTVELALINHLDVMISMDSANMHLASLAGTPVVSVWGATHRYCGFLGFGQSDVNVVETDLPCRPCSVFGDRPCYRGDLKCMTSIAPSAIIAKVDSLIARVAK